MKSPRSRRTALAAALGLSILAAPQAARPAQQPAASSQQKPATAIACAPGVRDQASPSSCLSASSVPQIGSLYPISQDLFVHPSTGHVGIRNTNPIVPLTVRGIIGMSNDSGIQRASIRPSNDESFGIIETFSGIFGARTLLMSTVSISPSAGAIGTQNGSDFLTLLTTPAGDATSGFVSVQSGGVEVAGIDGSTGDVFGASKSFVQPHPEDASKEIHYVSLEGPEHGVYFRGSSRLVGGETVLVVPESFRLVAREQGLTATITPLGPSAGLYVAEKGLERIVVRENPGGSGDAAFDFLVMGERSALPDHDPIAANRHFAPEPGSRVEPDRLPGLYRELMISNGTLDPDGNVNEAMAAELGWRFENDAWTGGPTASARVSEGKDEVARAKPKRR